MLTAVVSLTALAQDAPSTNPGFAAWARANATRLAAPDAPTCQDLEFLRPALARARVVAFGELIHDAHEIHLLRNRLVRCLTAHFGVTAVALESGFADAAPLHRALLSPPSTVESVTRDYISYGWGGLPEVQALTEMLRASNARKAFRQRVRLYGIDLTGASGSGRFTRAARSLDEVRRHLGELKTAEADRLASTLAPWLPRFSQEAYPGVAASARDSLRVLLDSAHALIRRAPASRTHGQSHDRAWALQSVASGRQSMKYFELLEALRPAPAESPDLWRLLQLRDSLMAANLLWALEQEGPVGRILVLAHDAHVFADSGRRTVGPRLTQQPKVLGQWVRAALGDAYVVIGTDARALGYYLEEQDRPDSASLGADLGRLGPGWWAIKLRGAREDPAAAGWVDQPRAVRSQWGYQRIRPAVAADFLVYADSLSPTGGELP